MLARLLVHMGASHRGAYLASFATYGGAGYLFSEFVRRGRQLGLESAGRVFGGRACDANHAHLRLIDINYSLTLS